MLHYLQGSSRFTFVNVIWFKLTELENDKTTCMELSTISFVGKDYKC